MRNWLDYFNRKGIPVPTFRDPRTSMGSVSFTMVVISFGMCSLGIFGKITKILGDVDMTNALWLLGISSGLYFGRRVSQDRTGKISIDGPREDVSIKVEEKTTSSSKVEVKNDGSY